MVQIKEFIFTPTTTQIPLIKILVGSQTGNGESLASILSKELFKRSIISKISLLSEYNIRNLPNEYLVLFIVSTYGQGEPPTMMRKFWDFIMRKDIPAASLSKLSFGVFGLGDSTYKKFNIISKVLDLRLEAIGATKLLPRGEGDEQHPLMGIRYGFNLWLKDLFLALNFPVCISNDNLIQKFGVLVLDKQECHTNENYLKQKIEFDLSDPELTMNNFMFQLNSISRLTCTSHFQNVSEYTFNNADPLEYNPGDIFKIYPRNNKKDVDYIISFFGWDHLRSKSLLEISCLRPDSIVPSHVKWLLNIKPNITTEEFLLSVMHISNCTPNQEFFETIWSCIRPLTGRNDVLDLWIDKFKELSGDYDEYLYYCFRPKRRIIQILEEFSISASIAFGSLPGVDFGLVFELFPWIYPRSFSISSAVEKNSRLVSITVATVEYEIGISKKKGFCSDYLNSISLNEYIIGSVHQNISSLKFPNIGEMNISPVILLCSGTGIAPMRAFIQQCYYKLGRNSNLLRNSQLELYLVYGCRYLSKDALYISSEEFLFLEKEKILSILCKGSRDHEASKIYLQHILSQNAALLQDLIVKKNAQIFLCGNSKLPKAIRKALIEIVGDGLFTSIEAENRFQYEVW